MPNEAKAFMLQSALTRSGPQEGIGRAPSLRDSEQLRALAAPVKSGVSATHRQHLFGFQCAVIECPTACR